MTPKELLLELNACQPAIDWIGDRTTEQMVADCHRGDWLLWLAQVVDIGLRPLTLAKGHCAATVIHLMQDERSWKAIQAAIDFGEGRINADDLSAAAAAASSSASAYASDSSAAAASAYAAAAASASSAYASFAASAAAYAAAYAASSASAAASAAAAARNSNQLATADICRKHIGELIVKKVNEILKTNDLNT